MARPSASLPCPSAEVTQHESHSPGHQAEGVHTAMSICLPHNIYIHTRTLSLIPILPFPNQRTTKLSPSAN